MPFLKKPVCFLAVLAFISFFTNNIAGQTDTLRRAYCSADSSLQYSLYFPSNYTKGRAYPLIIFLDPAARGDLPVTKYKSIADEYGVIFAGSFNSRNFNPSASTVSIAAIYDDLLSKYAIDTARVWLAGFSGGARMATSFAGSYSEIKGMIACGAGFTGERSVGEQRKIPFAGIVGNTDMNYEELLGINESLEAAANDNLLLLFDGGHQWPPTGYFGLAVCWLMRSVPGEIVSVTCSKIVQAIQNDSNLGLLYPAWLKARELKKISSFAKTADSLQKDIESVKGFKQDKLSFGSLLNEERKYMDELSVLFNKAVFDNEEAISDSNWREKAEVIEKMRKSKNNYSVSSAGRCIDFSWRLCIEYYFQFMTTKQYGQAYKTAHIISFFETGDNSPDLLMATAAAGLADKKLCLKHLRLAIKTDKIQKDRITADPLLLETLGKDTIDKLFITQ